MVVHLCNMAINLRRAPGAHISLNSLIVDLSVTSQLCSSVVESYDDLRTAVPDAKDHHLRPSLKLLSTTITDVLLDQQLKPFVSSGYLNSQETLSCCFSNITISSTLLLARNDTTLERSVCRECVLNSVHFQSSEDVFSGRIVGSSTSDAVERFCCTNTNALLSTESCLRSTLDMEG